MLSSCRHNDSSRNDAAVSKYADEATALAEYDSFSAQLTSKKTATTSQLIDIANKWLELDKQVTDALSAEEPDSIKMAQYDGIHEIIIENLDRLVDSKPRTLADYAKVVKEVKIFVPDSATMELAMAVHKFYGNLDKQPLPAMDARQTVKSYEQLLTDALDHGFKDKADLYTFLRKEDMAFRSFFAHLPEASTMPLESIRDNTALAMREIVALASGDSPMITTGEAVVLMTMRTSRRLLQNALQCVNDIISKKVANGGEQAMAYQWMLMQPWLTFDAFIYSLMSDAQWRTIGILASETPKCLSEIGADDFPVPLDELASLLIKAHLSLL